MASPTFEVLTNQFEIEMIPQVDYLQYSVEFNPPQPRMRKRFLLMGKIQDVVDPDTFNPRGIYDGTAILYLLKDLPSGERIFEVTLSDNPKATRGFVKVRLRKTAGKLTSADFRGLRSHLNAATLASNPRATMALNLLQLLIRQHTEILPHNKNSYFLRNRDTIQDIDGGLELLRGYFQSIRPAIGKLFVNIDLTVAAFYKKENLMDVALKHLGTKQVRHLQFSDKNDLEFKKLSGFLRNVRVRIQRRGGVRVIRGLEPCAQKFMFVDSSGREISVTEHMRKVGVSLSYPFVFGVRVSPKGERAVVYPAEMCSIEDDIIYKRALNERQTADMVKFATMRPQDRLNYIGQGPNNPVAQLNQSSAMSLAQMRVSREPQSIKGRFLAPPTITYSGEKTVTPENGAWNVVGKQLFRPPRVAASWAVVSAVNDIDLNRLVGLLMTCSTNLGLGLQRPEGPFFTTGHRINLELDTALLALDRNIPHFILVILPQNAKDVKQCVKYWGDIKQGCLTQCVREKKLLRANDQYGNNVLLKINTRLGGLNAQPRSRIIKSLRDEGSFIVFGADVGHAAPSETRPSIASVVWSTDADASKYSHLRTAQGHRVEKIEKLQEMVSFAIHNFLVVTSDKDPSGRHPPRFNVPRRIFFYRDGIAESQQANIAEPELKEIRAAIAERWAQFGFDKQNIPPPKITYIVVSKRHHVVFFPKDSRSRMSDRTGNLRAGFVTEDNSGISSPFAPDFFLQSHSAIQGTSRSSHYVVYCDENFQGNTTELKELSFHLCHVYAKATRSVSIPAPVYYADLACAHAALNAYDLSDPGITYAESATDSSQDKERIIEKWKNAFKSLAHPKIVPRMYYI